MKKVSLSRSQRKEIYKYALKHLNSGEMYNPCLCHALTLVIEPSFRNTSFKAICEKKGSMFRGLKINHNFFNQMPQALGQLFPEFDLFKPTFSEVYWFDNTNERKIVLELCIAMTS